MSNHLKVISRDNDTLRVGNYITLYGGKDLDGEHFTEKTDFGSTYTKTGMLYVDWEHGYGRQTEETDDAPGRDDILGVVDWSTAKSDTRGMWVERILDRRNQYVQWLEQLIEEGMIGNSSEAVAEGVEKSDTGAILRWPLKRDTLTVNPAEPRMLTENVLAAVKALKLDELLPPNEPEPKDEPEADKPAGSEGEGDAVKTTTETDSPTEEIEMDENKEVKTVQFTEEELAAMIAGAVENGAKKALDELPAKKAAANIEVTRDEADESFKSLAEQSRAVKAAKLTRGQVYDPRLKRLDIAYQKSTGANIAEPSEGGFMLEPELGGEILRPMWESGPFTQDARRLPTNRSHGWMWGIDETSRATGSRWGGIRGYRLEEGGSITTSKPKFRRITWELKKYALLIPGTDELLADAPLFATIVREGAGDELSFMANDDIFNGTGTAGPLGILNSPALISATAETGQAADTIVNENISAMWARLHPRNRMNAKWYYNVDCEPQLDALALAVGTSALEPRFVQYNREGVMTIKGKPAIATEFNATLGDAGDLVVLDMSDYLLWMKEVQAASSIHYYFNTDEQAFRFILRIDGEPATASALTPYKGTNTLSPYVALAARA